MSKLTTTILDEEWCKNFYFRCMANKKFTETENLEIIDRILSLDADRISLVEIHLIDPIYAPRLLSPRECEDCEKKSYSVTRISTKTNRIFLCRDCIENIFKNSK